MELQTRFCTSADGTRIAYAALGSGPPLVSVIGWGFHLESLGKQSEESDWAERLGRGRLYVRFDRRGIGASQRDVEDLSLEAQVADLAAVVDHIGLDQFDLWGALDGAAAAVAYAAQRPERLSRLVLWAPFPQGADIISSGQSQSIIELVRQNWSLARRAMADVVYPSGPTELQRWLAGVMRESISPEMAAKYLEFQSTVDVTTYLPLVKAPTLVLHRRGDRNVPSRAGMGVATLIPDARFVVLEGDTGVPSDGDTSYLESVIEFLDEGREAPTSPQAATSVDVHTILFTDMEGSTALRQRLGDAKAQELVHAHDSIVREALQAHSGREIKHTGDGIMASFGSASQALDAAVAIQRAVAAHSEGAPDDALRVYIGMNAGEPIAEGGDLFGTSVDLAKRICDQCQPGEILASDVVRQLVAGKDYLFADRGDTALRGFEDPVRLYELRWREA
ncbi:MAG: adenylate/guanylate cyclase domain-containing protein [Chloroflexi bacterium]|nr:adenylate/guanylate cyclase domain-containing protein [Chloroflexota bacterium]